MIPTTGCDIEKLYFRTKTTILEILDQTAMTDILQPYKAIKQPILSEINVIKTTYITTKNSKMSLICFPLLTDD